MLENDISEAMWRTILRGRRPPSNVWPRSGRNVSAVTGKAPKKVPASSGVEGENVKKAEPKPVRPPSRSPDEARADAVARVASLEAAIAALGDLDDQVRKSLEETLAKAKKSAKVAPVGVRLNSAMNFIAEEGGNKGRRDCQKGRGSSVFYSLSEPRRWQVWSQQRPDWSLSGPRRRRPTFQHHLR